MFRKPFHLIVILLAAIAGVRAADMPPDDGAARNPPTNPNGAFEIEWVKPRVVDPFNFSGVVIFSADGKRLLVAHERQARLWDTSTWKPVGPQINLERYVHHVTLDAAGKRVLLVADIVNATKKETRIEYDYINAESRVWDVETGKPVGPVIRHDFKNRDGYSERDAELSPDGQFIAIAPDGKTAELRRADTGEKVHSFEHKDWIHRMAFSEDGGSLIVCDFSDRSHTMNVWSVKDGKRKSATQMDGFLPNAWASGRVLMREIGAFRVCDIETGRQLLRADKYDKVHLGELLLSANGKRVAVEDVDGKNKTEVWDVDNGKQRSTIAAKGLEAIDAQGSTVLITVSVGDEAWESILFDAESGKEVRRIKDRVVSAAFTPDGSMLAIIGNAVRVIHADPSKKGAERWRVEKEKKE